MEVVQVLRMNGGVGDTSYANNSLIQQNVISMTLPITEEVVTKLYCSKFPAKLAIADLGCSSGPNTLLVVFELIRVVNRVSQKLGSQLPEFQLFLNDLPGNDFNTIFKSLTSFQQKLRKQIGPGAGQCFFNGVPGSFYGRLFPTNSLHFLHSSYSLHWLSQVPEGILESNKGNIYMASKSPPSVLTAYYQQFQRDFSLFLKCRSEELVAGGSMVLTFQGRKSEDPSSKECCFLWDLMALALNDMVSEGIIEEEKLDSFNVPQYTPSPNEIKSEVIKEGSYGIDHLEVSEVDLNAYRDNFYVADAFKDDAYNVAQSMRAAVEPLLVNQFGESIIDEVFKRYKEIVAERMSKEKMNLVNVTVSLTKIIG